jgi:hypothetical protein
MKKLLIITMVVVGFSLNSFAQDKEEFKPSGSPTFKLFTNYHSTLTDGKTLNEFELTRAYLGYGHKFSENWSGKVIFDVGNPKDGGGFEMTAYVKNAYMNYNDDNWNVNFGIISTTAFKTQEKFWGYRYLLKSFQDEFKFGSSADVGISAAYKFNDVLSADVILVNGEGYKKLQNDSAFAAGIGLTLKPVDGLTVRGYYETMTETDEGDESKNTLVFFLGYKYENFSIGFDYTDQANNKKVEGNDMDGYSAYATYKVNSSKLFARYDHLTSNNDWNSKSGDYIVVGAEFNPVKGIKITPNYRHFAAAVDGVENIDYLYVNCEIKF